MEEIDLKEIFNVLWRRKTEIILILVLFFILGCVYTLKFTTPMYESSITLILVSAKNGEEVTRSYNNNKRYNFKL